ncbi:MAG: glycosyltransferase family 2 protein [Leptospirales bacterium]|nr:glycosyltransferase family 2 protein [Leptospirales bacterium]
MHNEAIRLERCLQSVRFADEIVVVDSFSSDDTARIARRHGARVVARRFTGYIDQKNFAISLARGRWILVIDGDEVCSEELALELQEIAAQLTPAFQVYKLPRISYYLGRWIKHGGWFPDYNIRFFVRGAADFQGGRVHETGRTALPTGVTSGVLEHYGYADLSDHLQRIDRYTSMAASDRVGSGKRSSPLAAVIKGIWKFLVIYLFRAGFLDGYAGLALASMGGYYNFLKYAKLWEVNQRFRDFRNSNERAKGRPV